MANKIVSLIEDLTREYFESNDLYLWDCEYVKEGRDWFLRVYIDRTDGEYVSTDDCEKVSEFISKEMDERDPIEQNYTLEVSSPGLERPLRGMEDFLRFAGETAEISLYEPLNGSKRLQGVILAPEDGAVRLETPQGVQAIPLEKIAKAKLSIVF